MNNVGWCPLFSEEFSTKCETDKCALWDKSEGDCILFSLKKSIDKITDNRNYDLHDINISISDVKSEISSVNESLKHIRTYVEEINFGIDKEDE